MPWRRTKGMEGLVARFVSYTVLAVCRKLYPLQYGTARWAGLIERAIEGRHHPGLAAQAEDVQQTLALIRFTLDGAVPFAGKSTWSAGG